MRAQRQSATRHVSARLMAAALFVCVLLIPAAASAFMGTLWSTDDGILGVGDWIDPGPTRITWEVTQDAADLWHYSYTFYHPGSATSHFILEVSDTFTRNDIVDIWGDYGALELKTHDPGSGNPDMPGSIYGIKFDNAWGNESHFGLSTYRAPVWGDFYAKGGNGDTRPPLKAQAWNAGFALADPIAPPADESINNHILVPDTHGTPPVPEPSTVLLMSTGLLGVACAWRRRK